MSSAVSQFVDSASKLAPSIDTALTDAEKNQSAAQTAATSALTSQQSAIQSVQDAVDKAYAKIADAHEQGGKAGAAAVKTAQAGLVTALQDGQISEDDAAKKVLLTQAALDQATDPQHVIDNLTKGLSDITEFEKNLSKIVADGGIELAQSLAAQGPVVAGAQAAAFAQDPKGVKLAEELTSKTDAAKNAYITYLEKTFGVQIGDEMAEQSGVIANQFHPDLATPTATALTNAEGVIERSKEAIALRSSDVGQGGVDAYSEKLKEFPLVSSTQLQAAQTVVTNAKGPLSSAASATASAQTVAYLKSLGLSDATVAAITSSQASWDGQSTVLAGDSARRAGLLVGIQFDLGIRDGINNPVYISQIDAAATAAATTAEAAAKKALNISSPSQVGVEIGEQFIAGIALGLADIAPIVTVSTDAATSMANTFQKVGTAALGGLVAGFNDPTILDAELARITSLVSGTTSSVSNAQPNLAAGLVAALGRPPALAATPPAVLSAAPVFNFALDIALEDGSTRVANLTFAPTALQLRASSVLVQKVVATVSAG